MLGGTRGGLLLRFWFAYSEKQHVAKAKLGVRAAAWCCHEARATSWLLCNNLTSQPGTALSLEESIRGWHAVHYPTHSIQCLQGIAGEDKVPLLSSGSCNSLLGSSEYMRAAFTQLHRQRGVQSSKKVAAFA